MADSTTIVIQTEGQRLLLENPATDAEIAAAVNIGNPSRVAQWRNGNRIPGPNVRTLMNAVFGIRPRAWKQRPYVSSSDDATAPASIPDTLAHCLELLAAVRDERRNPNTPAPHRVKLAAAEAKILEMRHKLESLAQLSEDRWVREHPAFKRHVVLIVDALREHPQAAVAVMHALEREGVEL